MLAAALVVLFSKAPMLDFVGVNGHTVLFRPELYRPVARLVRDYHPMDWDLGADTSSAPPFPKAANGVDWEQVYGSWKKAGFRTTVSVMFETLKPDQWKDRKRDAFAYGKAFAAAFGPSSRNLVECIEIGNEPKDYSEAEYREVFEAMARGVRAGDPKMKIGTCAVAIGKGDPYAKDVACLKGLEDLIDVYSIHVYAFAELWPTYRRTVPEDPSSAFLQRVREMAEYRRKHDPQAELWVTEFGWDGTDKKPTGENASFQPNTPAEQARYLVRSLLLFASMDVQRAYVYFFNDDDEPSLHAASGLTTKFEPKPAYHALAHLQELLGAYRYERTVSRDPWVLEFRHVSNREKRIRAGWATVPGARAPADWSKGAVRQHRMRLGPTSTAEIVFGPDPVYAVFP
jgi:serine/threonine-protein kinase ATR